MSENPNFIVQLFIRTLQIKHKLVFQKDKQEYFRVLFDTYLNGQGNPQQLKDYIGAGIEEQRMIDVIAEEVIQWQAKAIQMKAMEEAKRREELAEKSKMEEYVAKKTAKAKEVEYQRKEKAQEQGKKRHKGQHRSKPPATGEEKEGEPKGQLKGLKHELSQQGKQKCKFFPFCKNTETCQYYHPTEKVSQFFSFSSRIFAKEKVHQIRINRSKQKHSLLMCSYFPKCRYGESCLYEHQACKFKERCTKTNCPFAHPFKKPNPIEQMMKSFMTHHNPLSNRPKKKFHPKNKEQQPTPAEQPEEQPNKQ